MKTLLRALALGALVTLAPSPGSAQVGDGAVRIGADFEIIDLEVFPDRVTLFGFGVNGVAFGPSFGYQIGESIIVGSRFAFRLNVSDVAGAPDLTVDGTVAVVPYFEWMFPDPQVAPFVGAQAGVVAFFADSVDASANFVGGGFGGVHLFVTDSFSISPWGQVNFLYLGGLDDRAGFEVVALLSFEGWIGGRRVP